MADQILKGKKPGDIPVQHPEPYQLHLNKRAAAAIGLTLPADLVAEADKVLSWGADRQLHRCCTASCSNQRNGSTRRRYSWLGRAPGRMAPPMFPQRTKKAPDIVDEQLGFFQRREVSAARHLGPTLNVEET